MALHRLLVVPIAAALLSFAGHPGEVKVVSPALESAADLPILSQERMSESGPVTLGHITKDGSVEFSLVVLESPDPSHKQVSLVGSVPQTQNARLSATLYEFVPKHSNRSLVALAGATPMSVTPNSGKTWGNVFGPDDVQWEVLQLVEASNTPAEHHGMRK